MIPYWTQEQREDFRQWHEARLKELGYPPELVLELRKTREHWMPREPKVKT